MNLRHELLAVAVAAALVAPARGQVASAGRSAWPHDQTGRHADDTIRYGQLENGLRYAIRRTPSHSQMSLRFVILTGSLAETDSQQGLAHFIEHMAFRGSTRVPDGSLIKSLQRKGLALGADTNAVTSHESTIFKFDFPHANAGDLELGVSLLRETADGLTLSAGAIESERGAILAEERAIDTPAWQVIKAQFQFLLGNSAAADRWPIGKTAVISSVTRTELQDFYRSHYTPENALLVIIGDLPPDAVEATLRQRFGSWRGRNHIASKLAAVAASPSIEEQVKLFAHDGAPEVTQIAWVRPFDTRPDTDDRERASFPRILATLILNQRLSDISRQPSAPFIAASFSRANLFQAANISAISVNARREARLGAIKAVLAEQRRAMTDGFRQQELDVVLAQLRTVLMSAVEGAEARTSVAIADGIVRNALAGDVDRSPSQDLDEFNRWAPMVTTAEVDGALKAMFVGTGPVLFLAGAEPPPEPVAAYESVLQPSVGVSDTQAGVGRLGDWPYRDFGTPSRIVEQRAVPDLGLTVVRFDNDVTLTVKPTKFKPGEILVDVALGKGRLALPANLARSYWMVNGSAPAFVEGGTRQVALAGIQMLFASRMVSIAQTLRDDSFSISGRTRPQDFAEQMQLLAAYVRDPGYRSGAVDRARDALRNILPQADSDIVTRSRREFQVMLHGGDPRWSAVPSPADLDATSSGDLQALLNPVLMGPKDITIVGDVSLNDAIKITATTFGSLPKASSPAVISNFPRRPQPSPKPQTIEHSGRSDRAVAMAAWHTVSAYEALNDSRALSVAAAIIRSRLFDKFRTSMGATYTPRVVSQASDAIPGYGYLVVQLDLPSGKLSAFDQVIREVVAELASAAISDDELERAKRPIVEERERDRLDNEYWIDALPRSERRQKSLDAIRSRVSGIQMIAAADVQRVAKKYLLGKPIILHVVPSDDANTMRK